MLNSICPNTLEFSFSLRKSFSIFWPLRTPIIDFNPFVRSKTQSFTVWITECIFIAFLGHIQADGFKQKGKIFFVLLSFINRGLFLTLNPNGSVIPEEFKADPTSLMFDGVCLMDLCVVSGRLDSHWWWRVLHRAAGERSAGGRGQRSRPRGVPKIGHQKGQGSEARWPPQWRWAEVKKHPIVIFLWLICSDSDLKFDWEKKQIQICTIYPQNMYYVAMWFKKC